MRSLLLSHLTVHNVEGANYAACQNELILATGVMDSSSTRNQHRGCEAPCVYGNEERLTSVMAREP
jgi:hypothetical protein